MQGKRLDLLGRVQYVPLDSSAFGTSYLIFQTSNTDFRGNPIYIAYISVDFMPGSSTSTFPAGSVFVLGSGGSTDFLGNGAIDLVGQSSGVLISNQVTNIVSGAGNQPAPLITYTPQTPIYVVVASSATSSDLLQFSAWGWGVN